MSQQQTFVENVKRRTFVASDKPSVSKPICKAPPSVLVPLTSSRSPTLPALLGRRLVHPTDPRAGGFYCEVCEVGLQDSGAWLGHINGKQHCANVGMSMRVERAGVDRVRERMEWHREQVGSKEKEGGRKEKEEDWVGILPPDESEEEGEQIVEKKKKKKKNKVTDQKKLEVDPELAAMKEMGFEFASFGGKGK